MGFIRDFIRRERNGNRDESLPKVASDTVESSSVQEASVQQKRNYASKNALFKNITEDDDQYWIEIRGTYYCFPERLAILVDTVALEEKVDRYLENLASTKKRHPYLFEHLQTTELDTIAEAVGDYVRSILYGVLDNRHVELLVAYKKNSFLSQEQYEKITNELCSFDKFKYLRIEREEDFSSLDLDKALGELEGDFSMKAYRLEKEIRKERVALIQSGATPKWKGYKPSRLTKGKKRV